MTRQATKSYELLTDREVEAEYKIPRATQKKWRSRRFRTADGLPFLKIGRAVRYRRSAIEAWLSSKEKVTSIRTSTPLERPVQITMPFPGAERTREAGEG